jgi:hypothetical protein
MTNCTHDQFDLKMLASHFWKDNGSSRGFDWRLFLLAYAIGMPFALALWFFAFRDASAFAMVFVFVFFDFVAGCIVCLVGLLAYAVILRLRSRWWDPESQALVSRV